MSGGDGNYLAHVIEREAGANQQTVDGVIDQVAGDVPGVGNAGGASGAVRSPAGAIDNAAVGEYAGNAESAALLALAEVEDGGESAAEVADGGDAVAQEQRGHPLLEIDVGVDEA